MGRPPRGGSRGPGARVGNVSHMCCLSCQIEADLRGLVFGCPNLRCTAVIGARRRSRWVQSGVKQEMSGDTYKKEARYCKIILLIIERAGAGARAPEGEGTHLALKKLTVPVLTPIVPLHHLSRTCDYAACCTRNHKQATIK